jgi:hypothetical protein
VSAAKNTSMLVKEEEEDEKERALAMSTKLSSRLG